MNQNHSSSPVGLIRLYSRYQAKSPADIKFAPLNKEQEYTAEQLMTLYEVRRRRHTHADDITC
jgi:hypothetical protein